MEDTQPDDAELDATTHAKDSSEIHKKHTVPTKHRKTKIFLVTTAVLIVIIVFIAGWFGFVPGVSHILGADKPRDLGVSFTEADYESYKQKTKIAFKDYLNSPDNPSKPGKKTVFSDPLQVNNLVLTDSELTAAGHYVDWLWMPLKNAQVKFSSGGVELSGNINVEYLDEFIGFIGGVGYSDSDVQKGIDYGKKLVGNSPAIYIKSKASVTNDVLSYSLDKVQIGRFSVPLDIASKVLSTGTTNAIVRADNFEVTSATAKEGELHFTGTYPTTIYVKH